MSTQAPVLPSSTGNDRTDVPPAIRVCVAPDWRAENPYLSLLADGVSSAGAEVDFLTTYRRGLPLSRGFLARKPRPEVLHLHWLPPYLRFGDYCRQVLYALKFACDLSFLRRAGVGIVWTVHNIASHEARYPRLERWIHRLVAARADRMIVHSQSAAAEAASFLGCYTDRMAVIPHGHYKGVYPDAPSRAAARQNMRLGREDETVFLFLGLLRSYKGIEELLDAWRVFLPKAGAVRLVIAGRPVFLEYVETLRQRIGDLASVDLRPGFIPDGDIASYLAGADVMVLPFRKILTSGSLLLAMSYGRPVIAPQIPLVEELLGSADDLTYSPSDPQGLSEALLRACSADLASIEAKTADRVHDFNWETIGAQTFALYAEAADLGRKRRRMPARRSAEANPNTRKVWR